ncbi:MAG: hypothetical protein QM790_11235 [Nibricoccus sp.]
MNLAEEFAAWVREPSRTNEELFLAELLIEEGHGVWRRITKAPWSRTDFDALAAHRKRRMLNPAYRAKLNREKLAHTVEAWAEMDEISNHVYEDRPVRDLSALRFFPHLKKLELRSDLADLSGLEVLQSLRQLELRDTRLADLGPLAKHPQLEKVSLDLEWPWPALASLATLPQLKELLFEGNILALAEVKELPAVETATFGRSFYRSTVPLRVLEEAPAMPLVRDLTLHSTTDLRGLERYERLEKLKIGGPFEDLSPFGSLSHLRELTLSGERFSDLAPLARLPHLRTLELNREHGLDLTPLSDSPSLRSVKSNCEVLKTELATLNAALGFIDVSDFLAPEPRPVLPLRFLTWRPRDPEYTDLNHERQPDERIAAFGDDPLLKPAEKKWFSLLVREKLKPFGDERWIQFSGLGDTLMVKLFRPHEALSLRQMIDALHPLLRLTRFHWEFIFDVELNGDPDEDDWERPDYSVFDAEREREEWEDTQERIRERKEMLEREHQLNLQKQQGLATDTGASEDTEDERDDGAKPEEPAASKDDAEEDEDDDDEFVDDRSFRLWISNDIVWMTECEADDVVEFLGPVKLENWHQLPEPPAERPYLHDW